MNANDYQRLALRTEPAGRANDERLLNAALGLAGEAGEFADLLKKARFQGHQLDEAALANELGDILWYAALAADALGLELDTVMANNIEKLRRRYPAGFAAERSRERDEV